MRFWIELRTLLHRPKTQTKNTTVVYRRRVDWRTAISTERQHTFVAAVGSLYIRLRFSAKFEVLCLYRNRDSVRCAGNGLTVSAVANDDVLGIYVRLIADPSAMTTAINFHSSHPNIPFCIALSPLVKWQRIDIGTFHSSQETTTARLLARYCIGSNGCSGRSRNEFCATAQYRLNVRSGSMD